MSNLIIETGSFATRVGKGGDDEPRSIEKTIVGRDVSTNDCYVGMEAWRERKHLKIKVPIQYGGLVDDWKDMEEVWQEYCKRAVRWDDWEDEDRDEWDEDGVILIVPPTISKEFKKQTAEMFFEKFRLKNVFFGIDGAMAAFADGKTTGLVCDFGHCSTRFVPVKEGYVSLGNVQIHPFGGRHLQELLTKALSAEGHSMTTPEEQESVRVIKEKMLYVAGDYDKESRDEVSSKETSSFELPDEEIIYLKNETRFGVTEALFAEIEGDKKRTLQAALDKSFLNKNFVDMSTGEYVYVGDVIPTGGVANLPGLDNRLALMVQNIDGTAIGTVAGGSGERDHKAWYGGSLISTLSIMNSMFITSEAYKEKGLRVIDEKFPVQKSDK